MEIAPPLSLRTAESIGAHRNLKRERFPVAKTTVLPETPDGESLACPTPERIRPPPMTDISLSGEGKCRTKTERTPAAEFIRWLARELTDWVRIHRESEVKPPLTKKGTLKNQK
jgi:hypothetical protein